MKIEYDKKADAIYIHFQQGEYEVSEEIVDGIIVDYTKDGKVIGIEILEVSKRMPIKELQEITFTLPSVEEVT